jgi:hypothetical protein
MHRWIPVCILALVAVVSATAEESPDSEQAQALLRALDDERRSEAAYRAVVARHGEIRPFVNIAAAEQRHQSHLLDLLELHGIEAPDDPWNGETFDVPATVTAACLEGIESETANVALYDELLEKVADADVRDLFLHLREMSLEHHLPAFQRCASRPGRGGGRSEGAGRGGCGGCCRRAT